MAPTPGQLGAQPACACACARLPLRLLNSVSDLAVHDSFSGSNLCRRRLGRDRGGRTSLPGGGMRFPTLLELGRGAGPPSCTSVLLGGGSDPPSCRYLQLGGGSRPPTCKSVQLGGGNHPQPPTGLPLRTPTAVNEYSKYSTLKTPSAPAVKPPKRYQIASGPRKSLFVFSQPLKAPSGTLETHEKMPPSGAPPLAAKVSS